MPDEPALLARGPWHPDEVEVALARRPLRRRRRRARRRPTPRSPRCATAARPATTASPRGWSAYERATTGGCTLRPAADALGAAPRRGRRLAARSRRCASRATPTAAGSPAAARRGCRRGPGAGRSAPAARSRSARTRSTRSRASSTRSGRSRPSACAVEALVRAAAPAGDARRPGVAARGRRGRRPTTSTTPTPGGRPTIDDWPPEADEPLRRMAAPAGVSLVASTPSSASSFTHSAIYLDAARGVDRARACTRSSSCFGMGPRPRLDRDVRLLCIAAVRARVIPLRLGVTVAVIGGVGPFVGSYEFVARSAAARRQRTHGRAAQGSVHAY